MHSSYACEELSTPVFNSIMGCGSSRDLPVALDEGPGSIVKLEAEETQDGAHFENTPDHSSESITPPGLTKQNGTTNLMQSELDLTTDEEPDTRPASMSESRKGSEPVAFEVMDESLIKKHPPKKFQKLEDLQAANNLTPEELELKQEIARKRRQSILNKRVQSAKERSAKSAHIRSTTGENDENAGGAIESPEDM